MDTSPGRDPAAGGGSWVPLIAVALGYFMVILDATAVNLALPAISRDLGGGVTGLQWVLDGYTLAFAALLLSAGVAGDRFGPRRVFLAGLALFTAASAGLINTAQQAGSALGVAVAGSLLAGRAGFLPGLHLALAVSGAAFLAGAVTTLAAVDRRRPDRDWPDRDRPGTPARRRPACRARLPS
jgi:MFS family permease